MNKFLYLFIIVFVCLSSCKKTKHTNINKSNLKTLQNSFKDLDGNSVNLQDYQGKIIVLNFWETSCKPCIKEMPSLEVCKSLLENDNYVFLLASNEKMKDILYFKKTTNFNLNFIQYTGTLSELKINTLPTTFVYGEKGNELTKIIGAKDWSSTEMISKLKTYKNK